MKVLHGSILSFFVVIPAETVASAECGLWIHPGPAGFAPSNPGETNPSNK